MKGIDLDHVQEIHVSRPRETEIVSAMTDLYPELQIYYYPSKLYGLMEIHMDTGEPQITMNTCIRILRQMMRATGRRVITKKITKGDYTETVIIIYPKVIIIDNTPKDDNEKKTRGKNTRKSDGMYM
jgi:hypothetical protein